MSFVALSRWGDQRVIHKRRQDPKMNATHIPSIPSIAMGEGYNGVLNQTQERQIRQLVAAGSIIEAIKLYRSATGHGLRESKDYIDALLAEEKRAT